jgi:hypothetical protein
MAQDILTEAIPARSYTEGSALNLARAALFGVPLSKVESIVDLLRSYRGGKPNSLILGGPLGWSWQSTLDTAHHGSLAGPANAHRHSDLANIGIDDHHARDHATRHAVGGGDQVTLDASQIGSGTLGVTRGGTGLSSIAAGGILYASAANTLSRIAPTAANQVLRSTAANALQIAALVAADIPSLDAAKITSGTFAVARGGTGLSTIAAGGILYASALDTLSRIAPTAANQVLRSTGANALEIATLVANDIPSLDAAKITSGRFGMARMPDGTSGYYLKAQGSGVDPVYAAVPAVPSGLIAMWHGLIANIPSGWVICDGNNGTPNLLAKFVEGVATAATNPGATGGSTARTTAGHQHFIPFYRETTTQMDADPEEWGSGPDTFSCIFQFTGSVRTSTFSAGMTKSQTDSITDIRPPFYDVAYIMKT